MDANDVQFWNAARPRASSVAGKLTAVRLEHSLKAPGPIEVTLSGISIEVKEVHALNDA